MDEIEDWTVCRLCLQSDEDMKSIQEVTYNMIPFYNIYFEIIGISFTEYISFPGKICIRCETDILQAYMFREKVLETEDKLKDLLSDKKEIFTTELFIPSAKVNDVDVKDVKIEEDSEIEESISISDNDDDADDNTRASEDDVQVLEDDDKKTSEVPKPKNSLAAQKIKNMLSKLNAKSIKCKRCRGIFKGIERFKKHKCCNPEKIKKYEEKNKEKKTYECKECNKVYQGCHAYRIHMDKHTNIVRYPCPHCDKKFAHWLMKRNHIYKVHLKQKFCECSICGQGFNRKYELTKHIEAQHLKLRPSQCDHCGKTFQRPDQLKVHLKTHENGRYKCKECNKELKTPKTLIQHKRTHLTIRNYVCPVCSNGFTCNFSLKSHVRKLHPDQVHLLPPDGTIVNRSYLKKLEEMDK